MSTLEVNKITPSTGTSITLGDSGDTFTIPSGVTITNNGTQTGFGGTNTPAFEAYGSTNQSVSDVTYTKVQIDTEIFDTDGYYDNTTNYRFTPLVAGKYFVYISIGLHALAVSELQNMYAGLSKNGTIIKFSHHNYTNNNIRFGTANITAVVELNGSTDYIEAKVIGADASGNASVSDNEYSTFGAYKLIGA